MNLFGRQSWPVFLTFASTPIFHLHVAGAKPQGWPTSNPTHFSPGPLLPAVTVKSPDDALLRSLLVKLSADCQLVLDESVVSYLVNRIDRSFAAARTAIQILDDEAMRRHRPVTRALAIELFRTP